MKLFNFLLEIPKADKTFKVPKETLFTSRATYTYDLTSQKQGQRHAEPARDVVLAESSGINRLQRAARD